MTGTASSNFGCLLDFHVCGIFSSLRGRKRYDPGKYRHNSGYHGLCSDHYEAGMETMDLGVFISFDDAGNANTAE